MRLFTIVPDLIFLTIFAHALLRLALSGMFAYNAWTNASRPGVALRLFGFLEIVVAAALFVGAWTQAFASLAALLLIVSLARPQFRLWPRSTVALMLVIAIALIATGPGAFAFDLPF